MDVLRHDVDDREEAGRAQLADGDLRVVGGERGQEGEDEEAEEPGVYRRAEERWPRPEAEPQDPAEHRQQPGRLRPRDRVRRGRRVQEQASDRRALKPKGAY